MKENGLGWASTYLQVEENEHLRGDAKSHKGAKSEANFSLKFNSGKTDSDVFSLLPVDPADIRDYYFLQRQLLEITGNQDDL